MESETSFVDVTAGCPREQNIVMNTGESIDFRDQSYAKCFDPYYQAENRVTHALLSCLHNARKLIRPFLKTLGLRR